MEERIMQSTETAPVEKEMATDPETDAVSSETEQTSSIEEQTVESHEMQQSSQPEMIMATDAKTTPLSSDITHRLAEEFMLLREEFPQLQQPEQLPDAVLNMAVDNRISLFDAYLRFQHAEKKRIRREQERRRDMAARSAGSLMQGDVGIRPEQDAFSRAFRTALN